MSNQCKTDNCAHFISVERLHIYRNKFLCSVVISTLAVAALFCALAYSYHNSLNDVVKIHQDYTAGLKESINVIKHGKDSCVYVNDQLARSIEEQMHNTQALLQIQSSKIQSDFTLLSVWSGLLMIVFLIFSIYSIFKTDELMKQGREGLRAIEESKSKADGYINQIDVKAKEEIKKVSSAADNEIKNITQETTTSLEQFSIQVEEEKKKFNEIVNSKADQFKEFYEDYIRKLEDVTKQQNSLFSVLFETAKNFQPEEQESENNQKKG